MDLPGAIHEEVKPGSLRLEDFDVFFSLASAKPFEEVNETPKERRKSQETRGWAASY